MSSTGQETPRLSIVIAACNSWAVLCTCLDSIERCDFKEIEILVIDNGSKDGTVANLRRFHPQVRVLENPTNLGHTRGVNQGVRAASGHYVMVLDADTELSPSAISRMLHFVQQRPDVSVVAPRTRNTDGTIQESARNLPDMTSGLFGRQSVLTRWFPHNRFSRRYLARAHLAASKPFAVEQVSGACMLFRRDLFGQVGEWDEAYFGYWVDSDWCARLLKMKKPVYCLPSAEIIHHEANDRKKRKTLSRIYYFHSGAFRFFRRHLASGWGDPRILLALLGLAAHAFAVILLNALAVRFRRAPSPSCSATIS